MSESKLCDRSTSFAVPIVDLVMKTRFITAISSAFFCLTFLLSFCGCGGGIIRYSGVSLKRLEYSSVKYNGGFTREYVFDFESNTVKTRGYIPGQSDIPDYEMIASFTDDEETELIDRLYSYGLFEIKNDYPSPAGIIDGGGWSLTVEYSDGTVKESTGSNNSPKSVFKKCANAFYDICGEGVVAGVTQK